MIVSLRLILLVLAVVHFALAAIGVSHPRYSLEPAGLFFLSLSMLAV